jgi:hypothetical protein
MSLKEIWKTPMVYEQYHSLHFPFFSSFLFRFLFLACLIWYEDGLTTHSFGLLIQRRGQTVTRRRVTPTQSSCRRVLKIF